MAPLGSLRLKFRKTLLMQAANLKDGDVVRVVISATRPAIANPPDFTQDVSRMLLRASVIPLSLKASDDAHVGSLAAEVEFSKAQILRLIAWPRAALGKARTFQLKLA